MNGKTNEEIIKEREELTEFAMAKLGSDVEIIDSFFKDAPHDAKPLWFLGKSFELLSTADACVFAKGYEKARGCVMEHKACENYGIKVFEYGNPVHNAEDDVAMPKEDCPTLDGAQVKPFKPVFNLEGTIPSMVSSDYKQRFVAEYLQAKIRYEKLKNLNNKYLVTKESGKDYLGFKPSCSLELLARQQRFMGEYLACLEQRAVIEDIELPNPYVNW
jgi:hypothetical protein